MKNKNIIQEVLEKKYNIQDYELVYNKMKDEKSKKMLFNRVMYDNTKQTEYILNLIKNMYEETNFKSKADRKMYQYINFLQKNENYKKKICFFGIGFNRQNEEILMWEFLSLIGQNEQGLEIEAIYNEEYGFKLNMYIKEEIVKNIEEFYNTEVDNNKIYIIIDSEYNYIEEYLIEKNISKDNIFKFNDLISEVFFGRERQYIDEVFVNYSENEILIDGGASNLETTLDFIDVVDEKYEKIYVIEPFYSDYEECNRIIEQYNLNNIETVNCGLWSKNEKLYFNPIGYGSSYIGDEGEEVINCQSIDSILDGKKATIIKMDIEGSEKEALIGATKTIKEYHPILMICVYHKPNDVIELTKTVFNIRDDYDLYLRHYSYTKNETVLYFIPKE